MEDTIMQMDGDWYKLGELEEANTSGDNMLLGYLANITTHGSGVGDNSRGGWRHTLTPLSPDDERVVAYKLGPLLAKLIPKELHARIADVRIGLSGETCFDVCCNGGEFLFNASKETDYPVVILNPPPVPEKTAEELLAEVLVAWNSPTSSAMKTFGAKMNEIEGRMNKAD